MLTPSELVEDEKYRRLTPLAPLALLLALASPLALVGPLFYLLPAAAIGLACLAIGAIRRSDGTLTGARLAHAAVGLAALCIAAALVRGEVRDRLLRDQAGATAQRWLGMMTEGHVADARALLTGDAISRLVPRSEPGATPPSVEDFERMALEKLSQDPLSQDAVASGEPPIFRVEALDGPSFDSGRTIVGTTLLAIDPRSEKERRIRLQLIRSRNYESEGEPWRINAWSAEPVSGDR